MTVDRTEQSRLLAQRLYADWRADRITDEHYRAELARMHYIAPAGEQPRPMTLAESAATPRNAQVVAAIASERYGVNPAPAALASVKAPPVDTPTPATVAIEALLAAVEVIPLIGAHIAPANRLELDLGGGRDKPALILHACEPAQLEAVLRELPHAQSHIDADELLKWVEVEVLGHDVTWFRR